MARPGSCNLVMMAATELVTSKPRIVGVVFRTLFVTFLLTLLSFAVSLLVGIVGTVLFGTVRGHHPEMTLAYRHVAFPVAITVAAVALIVMAVVEVRRYRQRLAIWRGF